MKYRITIKRIDTVPFKDKEYQQVADKGGRDGGPKYEYVYFDSVKEEITTVFEQEIGEEEFNVARIIRAVNDLK